MKYKLEWHEDTTTRFAPVSQTSWLGICLLGLETPISPTGENSCLELPADEKSNPSISHLQDKNTSIHFILNINHILPRIPKRLDLWNACTSHKSSLQLSQGKPLHEYQEMLMSLRALSWRLAIWPERTNIPATHSVSTGHYLSCPRSIRCNKSCGVLTAARGWSAQLGPRFVLSGKPRTKRMRRTNAAESRFHPNIWCLWISVETAVVHKTSAKPGLSGQWEGDFKLKGDFAIDHQTKPVH